MVHPTPTRDSVRPRSGALPTADRAPRDRKARAVLPGLATALLATSFLATALLGTAFAAPARSAPATAGASVAAPLAAPVSAAAAPLPAPGESLERALAGGEAHRYTLPIPPGHFLRVVVEQRGIDVLVRLHGPAGDLLFEGDSPNGRHGPEPVSFVAPVPATAATSATDPAAYILEVVSPKSDAEAASYALRVEALRPAGDDDAKVVQAERLEAAAAVDAWVRGTAESRRRAVDGYRQALALWEALGEVERQAALLNNLGFLHARLGDLEEEREAFRRLLDLRQSQGDPAEIARARLNLATAHFRQGSFEEAESLYRQALEHFVAADEVARAAAAWNGLGSLHWRQGNLEAARQDFLRALELERRRENPQAQATLLNNLGLVERALGNTPRAEALFEEALGMARSVGATGDVSAALNNLGVLAEVRGRMQEALEFHRQVRDVERASGNRRGEAYALHNLGSAYLRLGDAEEAAALFRATLEIHRATGERSAEAWTLHSLGSALVALDRPTEAEGPLERALALARELEDRRLEVTVLTQLGRLAGGRGDFAAAVAHLDEALRLARGSALPVEEAAALLWSGRTRVEEGRADLATEPLVAALETIRRIGYRNGEASVLFELARARRAAGDLEGARRRMEESLAVLEELRSSVDIPELRSTFFADRREHHEAYLDLLMELHRRSPGEGWDRRAFEAAEQARARSLTDLLREAEVDLRRDADPALVARAVELGQQLNALERQRLEAGEGEADPARLESLAGRLAETRKELLWVEAEMRRSSPRYASLTGPAGVDLAAVRGELLDPGVVLLQYSLGEERSFLWRVSRDAFESFELPPATVIEAAARRLYEALRTPGGGGPAGTEGRPPSGATDAADAARELGRLLLAPVAGPLAEAATVAVVPDGALHFVPFAALDPRAGGSASADGVAYRPLVVDHEVVQLPSVAALAVLREQEESAPRKVLALFADPVFQAGDPRIAREDPTEEPPADDRHEALAQSTPPDALRGSDDALDFRRLRFSRREGEDIARLVAEDQRLLSFDFDASRETVENAALDEYRYLHFATHGVLDSRYPELSGLVLSLVDDRGEPREGFLRLHEIYNLDLDAEVVTLSACRTALGQEIRGEGVVGLTRGFMYAGAERVVASLWDVQDRATAEVMVAFYRGMLEEGLRPAQALRRAQVETWQNPRWSDPYYWAAFVLQGDWR